jgi:hypothetical protein
MTDCSQAQLSAKWAQMTSAGAYIIQFPTCTGGGNGGTWTSTPLNLTVPSNVTSVTLRGNTTMTCTGTPGTSTYGCNATDNTVIVDSITTPGAAHLYININGNATAFRMTGITWEVGNIGSSAPFDAMIDFSGTSHNFRIDHCNFNFTPITTGSTYPEGLRMYGDLIGVIDHNEVGTPYNVEFISAFNSGTGDSFGDASWATATSSFWGTANYLFIEANYLYGGPELENCYNGGRFVARYNSIPNNGLGSAAAVIHQTGGGGGRVRGCRADEHYHNYYGTYYAGNYAAIANGGSELVWGNTTNGYQYASGGNVIRNDTANHNEAYPPNGWGNCNTGTLSTWDGNSSGSWPCIDQPGRGRTLIAVNGTDFPSAGLTTTGQPGWPNQNYEPEYIWDNSVTGAGATGMFGNLGGGILAGRDYFTDAGVTTTPVANSGCPGACTPFTGATGTGWGVLAQRPTTCTAGPGGTYYTSAAGSFGVAYFATDTNTLYICYATNTWGDAAHPGTTYTPYVYPHPLDN